METVEKGVEDRMDKITPKESNQKAKPCQKDRELNFITMPCTKILYHLFHII